MSTFNLKIRTKEFAKRVIVLSEKLPNRRVGWTIQDQIIRSSTSVAANYRAANRSKSSKDFIYKMQIVLEEADETLFWLELISELSLIESKEEVESMLKESNELLAIFVKSIKTAKSKI